MKDGILYIDDEQENLESFRITFWMYYNISIASNTQQAREILKEEDVKVVITDQRMPNETGLEFVKNVADQYPDLVYIVLTGYTDIEVVIEALNHGNIYRFMTKPWELQEMRQSIDNALENYELKKRNKDLVSELKEKNEQLRKSEYKFRNIFNSSLDSISIIDANGVVLEVNAITCITTGYTREELLTNKFVDVFPPEQRTNILNAIKTIKDKKELFFETNFRNKDGALIFLDAIGKEIDYLDGKAYLIVARDISEKKELQQKIIKTTIYSEEKERTRIAQELHDGIGPLLSSVKLYAETYFNSENAEFKASIEGQILETIDDTIDHVAAISNNLSPHILKNFGLKTAIEKFCGKIEKSAGIKFVTNLNLNGRFIEEIEIMFYRVVIELVNNTAKHANANQIKIELEQNNNKILLDYSDNGIGFDLEELLKKSKGMGLFNIKSRIESLNGEIAFSSIPKKITQLKISVPYEQDKSSNS